jgi:hypothetical protein
MYTRYLKSIIFSLVLLVIAQTALAQQPQFHGFLKLDKRIRFGGDSLATEDFYNRFRIEMSTSLGEKLYTFASLDFRFYDFPRANSLRGLEEMDQQFPTDLSVWEAYADIYGFLVENFDLRVGKQRLAWGTADKLNPTDNLNPDDFSDLLNFAEKIPTWAIKGSAYVGDVTLTAIWLPGLEAVLLPRDGAALFLGGEVGGSGRGVQIVSLQDNLAYPARRPKNSMFAFKFAGTLAGWDYSLSYFNGYDDVPILQRSEMTQVGIDGEVRQFAASMDLGFPKMQVLGADFASELFGLGVWGEGALFFPKKVITQTVVRTDVGTETETEVALDDQPYLKFTLGADYTFPGGWYLNGQWMHGFFTERGGDNLHDYFLARLERSFLDDEVEIALGGVLEVGRWSDLSQNYGYGLYPEITYRGIDNLEVMVGAFLVDGKANTLFGSWNGIDQGYLRVKVSF